MTELFSRYVNEPRVPRHGTPSEYNYWGCRCDECRAWKQAYKKKYYKRDPQQRRGEKRRAYAKSPEKKKALARVWVEQNQDFRNQYMRDYYAANRERISRNIRAKERARNDVTRPAATYAGTRWTEAEDRVVMDMSMSPMAVALALGRTFTGTARRRSLLKSRHKGLT